MIDDRNRARVRMLQRERRARVERIDYTPTAPALSIIRANLSGQYPNNILSGVLDRIVTEWAHGKGDASGKNYGDLENPKTSDSPAGVCGPFRAHAYDFGSGMPSWGEAWLARSKSKQSSVRKVCGGRRRRDGKPCCAKSEPGKKRCKWHGGRSTGPRSAAGKIRAVSNLAQYAGRRRQV